MRNPFRCLTLTAMPTLLLSVQGPSTGHTCRLAAVPQENTAGLHELGAASVGADGRFVAFGSFARLVTSDINNTSDIYVLDLHTRTVTLESLQAGEKFPNGDGQRASISADGRFLVFDWFARSSVDAAQTAHAHVLLRDRQMGTTTLVSASRDGAPANGASSNAVISANGRMAAFESSATNLVPGPDLNGIRRDVYVVTLATGEISRASVDGSGRQPPDGSSFSPTISGDGRRLAFTSTSALDPRAPSGPQRPASRRAAPMNHVFVRDLERGTTRRISRLRDGTEPNGASYFPFISADGRWVAFVSNATNLSRVDSNDVSDIYLHDLDTSETTLVTRGVRGGASNGASSWPVVSRTGRYVALQSEAANLVCEHRCSGADRDYNLVTDVFVFDRNRNKILRISSDVDAGWIEASGRPGLDPTGGIVVFSSRRPIHAGDTRNDFDLFVWRACEAIGLQSAVK